MINNYSQSNIKKATFAGGCFWCMESAFEKLNGVLSVISGYIDGTGENPTYKDYAQKGYVEVIQITYDPEIIKYDQLLDVLWHNIDPTDAFGQFVDRGNQYRSAIFYHDNEQKKTAEISKQNLEHSGKFNKPIATEIKKAAEFYPAEGYHQDYYKTHAFQYKFYRLNSGRDQYLENKWGKTK